MHKTRRYFLLLFTLIALCNNVHAQLKVYQTTHEGRKVYVYPLRYSYTNSSNDIPPVMTDLPDGEYVMYKAYSFKKKFLSKKRILNDTTGISSVFSIKDRKPEGPVKIFIYQGYWLEGTYKNGLRFGKWTIHHDNTDIKNYNEKGELHGERVVYDSKARLIYKENYKEGSQIGEYIEYYPETGKVKVEYSLNPDVKSLNGFFHRYFHPDNHDEFGLEVQLDIPSYVHGLYKAYNEKGQVIANLRFYNGELIHYDTIYHPNMKPYMVIKKITPQLHDTLATFRYYLYDEKGALHKELHIKARNTTYLFERNGGDGYFNKQHFYSDAIRQKDTVVLNSEWLNENEKVQQFILTQRPEFEFEKRFSFEGRLLEDFEIIKHDTALRKVSYISKQYYTNGVSVYDYGYIYQYQTLGRITWNTGYGFDSSVYYWNNKPYTGKIRIMKAPAPGNSQKAYFDKNGILFVFEPPESDRYSIYYNRIRKTHDLPYDQGEMLNGQKQGEWYFQYSNSKKSTKKYSHYRRGQLHGEFKTIHYANLGKYERVRALKNGIKEKKFLYISHLSNYQNGNLHGYVINRTGTGITDTANYLDGKKNGRQVTHDALGRITELAYYKEGLLHGASKRYSTGVLISDANYKNGELDGTFSVFNNVGNPLASITANNGILCGDRLYYNRNGWLQEKHTFSCSDSIRFQDIGNWSTDDFLKYSFYNGKQINISCTYESYFNNGKIFASGIYKKTKRSGPWVFNDINGNLIHEVNYAGEQIILPFLQSFDTIFVTGRIISYYANGKKRCEGYILNSANYYDCKSDQNLPVFDIIYTGYWNIYGEPEAQNGNGNVTITDEHGLKIKEGEIINSKPHGRWKSYDPDGNLKEIGSYFFGERDGIWYEGDLQGLNFEDAACFDMSDPDVVYAFERNKKNLRIRRILYNKGRQVSVINYEMNMNKTPPKDFYRYKF